MIEDRPIPPDAVGVLIRVGQLWETDEAAASALFAEIRGMDEINCRHWSEWDRVTAALSDSDLAALVRSLTVVERELKWPGGSVSGVIWTFRALGRRGNAALSQNTAAWVESQTENSWAPHGSLR